MKPGAGFSMMRIGRGLTAAAGDGIPESATVDDVRWPSGWLRRSFSVWRRKSAPIALLLLAAVSAPAAGSSEVSAEMIVDLATDNGEQSSNPRWFIRAGNEVYFSATTPTLGRELYATDGVTPRVAVDLAPGPASSNASLLGLAGTRLVVEAEDGTRGNAVSAVDPVSGVITKLIDAVPVSDPEARRAKPIAQLGARMLFAIDSERALWGSDGTLAGTQRLFAQTHPEIEKFACSVGGKVLFPLAASGGGHALWRSDGSVAGTAAFADMPDEWQVHSQTRGGAYCYFLFYRADGWSLWRSDGTTAALVMSQSGAVPQRAVATPTTAYAIDRIGSTLRLWRAGGAAPLATVSDNSGTVTAYAVYEYLVIVATVLDNGVRRDAIFRSDGTAAGTRRLFLPAELQNFQSTGYGAVVVRCAILAGNGSFVAVDPVAGSVERPEQSSNIWLWRGDYAALDTAVIGVGRGPDGWGGQEVWRTDATNAGTRVLHDIWMGTRDSGWFLAVPYDSRDRSDGRPVLSDDDVLYFRASVSWNTTFLWRTDGTAAGTVLKTNFYDGDALWNVLSGERVLFASSDARNELRSTDPGSHPGGTWLTSDWRGYTLAATPNGAAMVYSCGLYSPTADLCGLRPNGTSTLLLTNAEDNQSTRVVGSLGSALLLLLGSTRSPAEIRGLWRSDGTVPGTVKLSSELFYPFGIGFAQLRQHGRLYFNAQSTATQQHGLYVSDGTAAGTALVASLSYPVRRMVSLGGDGLMFVGGNESSAELWYSDGTTSGTYLLRTFPGGNIRTIVGVGAYVHFVVAGQNSTDYYVSDGSAGGTHAVTLPAGWKSQEAVARLDDDTAGFSCDLPGLGTELCAIDADGGNPRLVREIFPGPTGSRPQFVGATRNIVFIAADDGYHGRELWRVTTQGDAIFAEDFEERFAP